MSKYNRSYHLFFSENLQNDDRMAKSIQPLLNREVVITEKLDGSNTCYTKDHCFGRSHAAPTNNPWDVKARELHSILKHSIDEDLFLFGEGMEAIHSIYYEKLTSCFYLFGAKYEETWASWDDIELYAALLNIPTVPVLFRGIFTTEIELKKYILDLAKKESSLGGEREGVVIRVADSFQDSDFSTYLQKFVRKNHVRTDEHWQRNWKKANINYGKL